MVITHNGGDCGPWQTGCCTGAWPSAVVRSERNAHKKAAGVELVKALDRKSPLRDCGKMKGQALGKCAGGDVRRGTYIMFPHAGALRTTGHHYRDYRFAEVFASLQALQPQALQLRSCRT